MFAKVLFNLPLDKEFDYSVPDSLVGPIQLGMRVLVPFGKRRLIGYISKVCQTSSFGSPKEIIRLLDSEPLISKEAFELAAWIATYYCCSLGQALSCFMPSNIRIRTGSLDEKDTAPGGPDDVLPKLTTQQLNAFSKMLDPFHKGLHKTFLLHGVTGSGKTELYMRLIQEALDDNKSAIVLVPEIALTPQAIDRFRKRFKNEVVLWHSRLSSKERAAQWRQVASGKSRIVLGTRSAVFAPVNNLGVIAIDEEHDPSYKQDQTPRYHAREVAIQRAKIAKAIVVLGDATPSVESYYAAKEGRFFLIELTQRVMGQPLPKVDIVDMRHEFSGRRAGDFSTRLRLSLERVLQAKEQAMLLINRRGFARVALCPSCGEVMRCGTCSVSLVYHASIKKLLCHYCNKDYELPESCPGCKKGYLRLRGLGSEHVESELHRLFPSCGIGRLDSDSTKQRGSHRRIYDAIKTHDIEMLVGTQMIAKGFDLPKVTFVGVVSADISLNIPDFRSGERTFDLLTQVAGRAGRGSLKGHVLIQTYCPHHYAVLAASRHDYKAFYEAEIKMRKSLNLPPFSNIVEVTMQARNQESLQKAITSLAEIIGKQNRKDGPRKKSPIHVLGPAPHRVGRVRNVFRWRLLFKAKAVEDIVRKLKDVLGDSWRFNGLMVTVDVDPL